MTVRSLDGRRIRKVFVQRKPDEGESAESEPETPDDDDDTSEELADAS
jgi:hypothetical protein